MKDVNPKYYGDIPKDQYLEKLGYSFRRHNYPIVQNIEKLQKLL